MGSGQFLSEIMRCKPKSSLLQLDKEVREKLISGKSVKSVLKEIVTDSSDCPARNVFKNSSSRDLRVYNTE